jgi:hypothetical protein
MLIRPSVLLRIEEAGLLAAAIALYVHFHFSWELFAVLFLAPDLFMLGYLVNPRVGAALYNLAHTLTGPLVLFALACRAQHPIGLAISIIWAAHIAVDRMLGFGLKYPGEFKDTHLQHIA